METNQKPESTPLRMGHGISKWQLPSDSAKEYAEGAKKARRTPQQQIWSQNFKKTRT